MSRAEEHPAAPREGRVYEILVQGHLDPSHSGRLQGMTIEPGPGDRGEQVTSISGPLPDQAALSGVLDTLFRWLVPVISVRRKEG